MGFSARWLCLRVLKGMNSGKGPLGTMGIMNIGNG